MPLPSNPPSSRSGVGSPISSRCAPRRVVSYSMSRRLLFDTPTAPTLLFPFQPMFASSRGSGVRKPFMKVLVLGSGGREHAVVWKLRQSPRIHKLYCAPGNGGISADAECAAVDLKDLNAIVQLANKLNPDITVVGPEMPLTLGVVDEFQRRGWPIFGPTRAAAQLESSKSFAKEFMQRHRIPTANYAVCSRREDLKAALTLFHTPIVIKADGLAAGK